MLSEAFCHFDSLSCTTHFHVRVHSMYQQAIPFTLYHTVFHICITAKRKKLRGCMPTWERQRRCIREFSCTSLKVLGGSFCWLFLVMINHRPHGHTATLVLSHGLRCWLVLVLVKTLTCASWFGNEGIAQAGVLGPHETAKKARCICDYEFSTACTTGIVIIKTKQ